MKNFNRKPAEILLVEDNEGDVILMSQAFKSVDTEVNIQVALDGEEALDFIYKRGVHSNAVTPDLILLDINTPKISGLEVLQTIKEDKILRVIPVIVMTSSKTENDVVTGYRSYANSYVTKASNLNELIEIVSSIDRFWLSHVLLPDENDIKHTTGL